MDEQQDDSNSQTELRIDTDANDSFSDGETSSPSEHETEPTLPVLADQREMLTPSPESDSNYDLVIKDDGDKICSEDDTLDELEGQETNAGENAQPSTKLTDSHDLIKTLDDDDVHKTAEDSEVKSPASSDAEFELSVQLNEEPGEVDLTENPDKRSTGQIALLDGDNEEPGTVKIELIEDSDLEKPDSLKNELTEDSDIEKPDSLKNELTEDSGSEDPEEPENVGTLSSKPVEKLYDDEVLRDNDDIEIDVKQETGHVKQLSDDESNFGEEVENIPHDTSDEGSDFAGFDSVSAEKTAEIIEILHRKQEELTQCTEKVGSNEANVVVKEEDVTVTDESFSQDDKSLLMKDKNPADKDDPAEKKVEKNETQVTVEAEANPSGTDSFDQTTELTNNVESAVPPLTQDAVVTPKRPLPTTGPHINIFEEQVPSGSKRVKKKRKFFGDFIESDSEKPAKKPNVVRLPESSPKMLNNISSENKENFMTEDKMKAEVLLESDTTSTPQPASAVSLGQIKAKRSSVFDISNPLFKEPFKHGWKREICYRNLPEGSKGKTAYVSYFGPQGKKFKSIRHIVEHLPPGSELNMQHFTFSKERIFSEPSEFEILRHAAKPPQKDLNESSTLNDSEISSSLNQTMPPLIDEQQSRPASKKKPTPSRAMVKKPKAPSKSMDTDDEGTLETSLLLPSVPPSTTPKIVIKNSTLNSSKSGGSKSKSSSSKKEKKPASKKPDKSKKKSESNAQSTVSMLDTSASDHSPVTPKNQKTALSCSLSCPLALGSFPTLQCTVCLSLYHFECCGVDSSFPVHSYVCKTCRSKAEVSSKLLLAVSSDSSHALCNNVDHSRTTAAAAPKNAKIVDGVTTWLPSSSNVRLSSRHAAAQSASPLTPEAHTPLLQSVLELDGRRYIIVPKESIVSISPNTNASINMYSGGFGGGHGESIRLERSPLAGAGAVPGAATPKTFLVNSSNVNSDGVLLVPVMPAGSTVPSPQHLYSDIYNHIGPVRAGKRKHSDESDTSLPFHAKMAKLDAEADGWSGRRRSALTLANVTQLYDALTLCFKYLTVRDLLRVSMSCKYLNRIASESSLWTTVRLKNSRVRDWEGFAKTLRKHGTKKLDMRKMLCSPSQEDAMWDRFVEVIPTVTSLEHIEFSRCSSGVVETVAVTCPNLAVINAVQLKNGVSFESFTKPKHLRELRLKGLNKLSIELCDDGELESELERELEFSNKDVLQVLSLTSVKKWDPTVIQAIADLKNLRVLELGECSGMSVVQLAYSLERLERLERLRLEQITNLDPKFELFAALKTLKHFRSLELINVDVKQGFDKAIVACQNIEELLIIPLYKAEAVTTNRVVMDSLQSLSQTLKTFVWCLTTELITATHLYAERYDEKSDGSEKATKKPSVDSIPILKSITKINEVEILSIRNLEKILALLLPHARHKVLKIPFNSTWRQSLSECFK